MQSHSTQTSTGAGATATDQSRKTVLPQVRYHPTIKTQTSGEGARPKITKTSGTRTSRKQKARPGAARPCQTGDQQGDNTEGGENKKQSIQKPIIKPNQKQVQSTDTEPAPPRKPDEYSNGALPAPQEVPLGEGRRVQTRAMSWGVNMEAKVVHIYQVQFNTMIHLTFSS
ncbi:hypothetical protein INR49_018542 [Caranx melampygus]|nr:hypothetical protein INR49_018542 [Caranx melampygus]